MVHLAVITLKQIIAVSLVYPNAQWPIASPQYTKQSSLNQLYA